MQVVRLAACGRNLALPVAAVREVSAAGKLAALFNAPPFVLGLLNLRGEPVPVLDPGALFQWGTLCFDAPYVVIVEWEGLTAGLAATPPVDIVDVDEEGGKVQAPDGESSLEAIDRVTSADGVPLLMLQPSRLFMLPAVRALRMAETGGERDLRLAGSGKDTGGRP